MSKSLDQLLESPESGLPERPVKLCISQKTMRRIYVLDQEKSDLLVEAKRERLEAEDGGGRKKRGGEGANPRIAEIDAELSELYDVMDAHTGWLTLRGVDDGTWAIWRDQHPPREDNVFDEDAGYGLCNAEDLKAELGTYAVAWQGPSEDEAQPLSPGQWDRLRPMIAAGDIKALVKAVVQMHEGPGAVPKSRRSSSDSPKDETD